MAPSASPLSRARTALAAVLLGVALAAASVVAPAAAHATDTTLSALFLRDSTSTVYRVADGDTTLAAGQANYSANDTTYPAITFTSQIGSDFSTRQSVAISAGITPGTYATARVPGVAAALLDPGTFRVCGGDEPGSLTVEQADYDGDGLPVDFTASFDIASCDSAPPVHGEIRWNSSVALGVATAPALTTAAPVTVNSSTEANVRFVASGNTPVTLGTAALAQKPMSDGTQGWSIDADGCSGRTLAPGASCTVSARIAPIRPDGLPYGTVYATLSVPDGQSAPSVATLAARVNPLPGQVLNLQAQGTFRQVVLTWQLPGAVASGWSLAHQSYFVYRVLTDNALQLVGVTSNRTLAVTERPDLDTTTYVVRDEQSGADAPLSLPASATTAQQELLYTVAHGVARSIQLTPQLSKLATPFIPDQHQVNGLVASQLDVARNQSVVAYVTGVASGPSPTTGYVCTAHVDSSPSAAFCSAPDGHPQWDTAPALSPDGSRVVFTHAASPGAATSLEIASSATGSRATVVPSSAGLSDAVFDASGAGLVAVRSEGGATDLVHLTLTGTRTAIAGSSGLSDPDVAANGTIVAVSGNGLVLLAPGATSPTAITGAQAGTNVRPHFSADGRTVFFTHSDTTQAPTDGYGDLLETGDGEQIDLASGTVTDLVPTGTAGTPYVFVADGTHRVDDTAPVVRMLGPAASVEFGSTVTAYWTAADAAVPNEVASYLRSVDVRYRVATIGSPLGAYTYPPAWQGTSLWTATLPAVAGDEYCFSARARDYDGNVSAWTPETCTISPVDGRSLTTTASRQTSSVFYRGTSSYAAKTGTHFALGGVTARRIGLVVTTCSACGQVQVQLGTHVLGRINTTAKATHYRQILWLPLTAPLSGTLLLTTLSAVPVRLDGVVVQH